MERDGLGLREVVIEQLAIGRLFVCHVTGEQVVEATMEDVRPVEGLRHLPRQTVECRRHLFLIRGYPWRAEDEIDDLETRTFDRVLIACLQKSLGQMRVAEVDAVELVVELRKVALDGPLP